MVDRLSNARRLALTYRGTISSRRETEYLFKGNQISIIDNYSINYFSSCSLTSLNSLS